MNRREFPMTTAMFDALMKPARSVPRLTLPLGIRPEDTSYAAFVVRRDLHNAAATINPKGYRPVGKKRGITKAPHKRDRSNRLALLARMDRGSKIVDVFGVA